MTTPGRTRLGLLLFALPGVVVFAAAGGLAWSASFDGFYGQDPFAYYAYATGPLRDHLGRGEWLPPFFWPPGYPLLVALAAAVFGASPAVAQMVSLVAGATVPVATAWLAYELVVDPLRAGRDLARPVGPWPVPLAVPFVAALAAACCAQLWHWSLMNMADSTALAAATLGAAALARYVRVGRGPWLTLASAALAWAVLSRWAFALVALPCAVCALAALVRRPPRVAAVHAGAAAAAALVVLLPVLGPVSDHLAGEATRHTPFIGDLQVIGWDPANMARREFTERDGRLAFRVPNGVYYALVPARWFFFTPALAPFIVPGAAAVLRARAAAPVLLLLAWPLVVLGFVAGMANQNPRFALPCLPPLAVLLAVGLSRWAHPDRRWRRLALGLVLMAGLVWMSAGGVRLTGWTIARKAEHLSALQWTERHVPAGARLLAFDLASTFQHYGRLETVNLFALTTADLAALAADPRPTYLVLDVDHVERQWVGLSPSLNYRWLRDGPGLVEIDRRGALRLFRIGP